MQTAPSTNTPATNTRPPSITRNSASAIAGTAAITRALRSERSRRRERRRLRRPVGARSASVVRRERAAELAPSDSSRPVFDRSLAISRPSPSTEPSPPLGVLGEGLLERLAREIRPKLLAKHQLRVGGLPQQVVGQAPLAAGADYQVRVMHLGRVQTRPELVFAATREAPRRVNDLGPPAVVECHEQRDPAVLPCQRFGPAHLLAQLLADAFATADEAHAHALLVELGR